MYIVGFHAIEEALHSLKGSSPSHELLISHESTRTNHLVQLASKQNVPVKMKSRGHLDNVCGGQDHRGAVLISGANLEAVKTAGTKNLVGLSEILAKQESNLLILLDHLSDPHNLGAILRSADQFGVDLVVLPKRRSVQVNETVAKVSAGASFYVHLHIASNLSRAIEAMKEAGFWVYGAEISGESPTSVDLSGKVALVFGGEGHGVSALLAKRCDALISIPTIGHVDSLNVSVAAGILLYEVQRQRGFPERVN